MCASYQCSLSDILNQWGNPAIAYTCMYWRYFSISRVYMSCGDVGVSGEMIVSEKVVVIDDVEESGWECGSD